MMLVANEGYWVFFLVKSSTVITVSRLKQIPPEAAYLYDAVTLYARAVNESLKNNQDHRNGKVIFEHLRGQPYFST